MRRGVSLIELLMVLAIVTIVIAISIPGLKDLLENNHDYQLQQQIISSVEQSQLTAGTSRRPVALCASKDALTCTTEPVTGLISFMDDYGDGVIHDKRQIVSVYPYKAEGKLYWRAFPGYRDYLLFLPSGLMHADNGTIWYCHPNSKTPTWAIAMNKAGRIRKTDTDNLPC